jgi:hypothetical protein
VKYYVEIAIKTHLRTEQIKLKDILFIKKYSFNSFGNLAIWTILQALSKAIYFSTLLGISSLLQFWFFNYSSVSLFFCDKMITRFKKKQAKGFPPFSNRLQ